MKLSSEVAEKIALNPVNWQDAFPWLPQLATKSRFRTVGLESFKGLIPKVAGDLHADCCVLADALMDLAWKLPLSTALPHIALDAEIGQHFFGGANGTSSNRISFFGEIADLSASSVAENYQSDSLTSSSVLPALFLVNIKAFLSANESSFDSGNWEEGMSLDDLSVVLDYVRGLPSLPSKVSEALSRLDVGSDVSENEELTTVLRSFVESLNTNEQTILRRRIVTNAPVTLQVLADELGYVRERIRQIENNVREKANRFLTTTIEVVLAKRAMFEAANPLVSVSEFESKLPELCAVVEPFEIPVWRVIDLLDPEIEADESWVAAPSLAEIRGQFDALVANAAEYPGAIAEETLAGFVKHFPAMSGSDVVKYAESLGYVRLLGLYVEPSRRFINSYAEIILHVKSEPLSSVEIQELLPISRSLNSIRNTLLTDPRFVRTAPDTYGLTEWGGENFQGIRNELIKRVRTQATFKLSDALVEFPKLFGVAETSVYQYAHSWPLTVVNENVVMATSRPMRQLRIDSTGRVYRRQHGASLRFTVNAEQVRGSGTPVSNQLGMLLGLREGDSLTFATNTSDLTISWGMQTQIGSIKSLLEMNGFGTGDHVMLDAVGGTVAIRRAPEITGNGIIALAKALGIQNVDDEQFAYRETRFTLGLEGNASEIEIEACLLRRGEDEYAKLLRANSGEESAD